MRDYLVRTGVLGHIHSVRAVDAVRYERGERVICRTDRGLEFGWVLNAVRGDHEGVAAGGTLLRKATSEDHLLWTRIERSRNAAIADCQEKLFARGIDAVLMDVELLFDGQSIFFYFLGEITPALESLIGSLSETYEARVQLRQFAETLAAGCGPDCGTKEGACEEGGCAGCAVASACGVRH